MTVSNATAPTGKFARLSIKNIDGKRVYYRDWFARVAAEADAMSIPESVREQITGAMLVDAWRKGEGATHFLKTCVEYLTTTH